MHAGSSYLMPVSTAECKRGFHSMNLIITDLRSTLEIKTVACLLFIYCNGPPLHRFDPVPYVTVWLKKGRHAATDVNNMARNVNKREHHHLESIWKLV
jgi:hypothetical protein